jgi:hypothetical protein
MINVKELNKCDTAQWLDSFRKNNFYKTILNDYDYCISSYREMSILKACLHHTVYETARTFTEQYRILDVVPYYYIDFLLKNHPKTIIDLGCGINNFKKYIPGLVGIDADREATQADIFDFFDSDFSQGHQQCCDALMSINAIHFSPVNTITQRLKWLAELIRPGGTAFVSTNLETWLMYTDKSTIYQLFGPVPMFDNIVNYINDQILATNLNLVVNDWPVLHYTEHSTIRDDYNGNIRLVFTV